MICAIALHAAPARAGLRAEVVEYGETTAERERPTPQTSDDHSLTPRTVIEGIRFVGHDSTLPARLCLRFGVSVRLHADAAEGMPRQLTVVLNHPRLTRPDGVWSTRDSWPTPVLGDTAYTGWTFDHPWELEPGDWTIAFGHRGEVIASQTFHITAPQPAGSVCQAPATS